MASLDKLKPSMDSLSDALYKRFYAIRKSVMDIIKQEVKDGKLYNTYSDKGDQDKVKAIDLFAPHPSKGYYVITPNERVHDESEQWFTENILYFMDEDLRKNKLGVENKPTLNAKRLLIVQEQDVQDWYKKLSEIWLVYAVHQHLNDEQKKKYKLDTVKKDFDTIMSDPLHEYQMKLLYHCKFIEDYPFMVDFLGYGENTAMAWGFLFLFDFFSESRMGEFVNLLNYKNEQFNFTSKELGSMFGMQYIQTKMAILNMFDPKHVNSTKYLGHMLNVLSAYLTFDHFDMKTNKEYLVKAIELMLEKGKASTVSEISTYCKEISDGLTSTTAAATSIYNAAFNYQYETLFDTGARFNVRKLDVYFENFGKQLSINIGGDLQTKKNLYKTIGGVFKLAQVAVYIFAIFNSDYWSGGLNATKGVTELTAVVLDLVQWIPTSAMKTTFEFFAGIGTKMLDSLISNSNTIVYKGLTTVASKIFSTTTAGLFVGKVLTPAISILTIIISVKDIIQDWEEGNGIGVFCDAVTIVASLSILGLCAANSIESFGATLILGLIIVAMNILRYATKPDPLVGYFNSSSFPTKYKVA
ncbi:hypothetical protein DLAC_10660 [Tieghemostelium lacteum]|uniref:Uncharacterized protein n=1 Tax=Tieghemostelium lacteum TaxID=361077 RepID=A0A151Z4H7_TIELA|nr:hypothetical protein DLAC_10660 [Tieghemostelium lacteum]|eukprot:KYQ88856.1 hypothetical protein DLAC_10660 [Tieghemostelium lacteum]